jgi:hypothetical protein
MNLVKAALVRARILHASFLTTQILFFVVIVLAHPKAHPVAAPIPVVLAVLGVSNCGVAFFFRNGKTKAAEERLRVHPDDATAVNSWISGNIISFAFAETCGLFGVALKFMGADWNIAAPFLVFTMLVLLLLMPRLDVPGAR